MAMCPYCSAELTLKKLEKETEGRGFFKQETMYSCPKCKKVLGFSRGKFTS
ncbi:hypothetical protein JW930_01950 [Candidatus Woesearchaeota archaeon]|nr:hypothetical protein [Candidatus Woesearchaeota archaeon]